MAAKIVNICELYGMFLYKNRDTLLMLQQEWPQRNYFVTIRSIVNIIIKFYIA
jgi:hypothetical protein